MGTTLTSRIRRTRRWWLLKRNPNQLWWTGINTAWTASSRVDSVLTLGTRMPGLGWGTKALNSGTSHHENFTGEIYANVFLFFFFFFLFHTFERFSFFFSTRLFQSDYTTDNFLDCFFPSFFLLRGERRRNESELIGEKKSEIFQWINSSLIIRKS